MGAMQRTKGAAGERDFAKLLGGLLAVDLKRNLDQTRDGGHDLKGSDLISGWAIEVKRAKKALLPAWWNQTVEQAVAAGKRPALAYRLDNHKWRVVVHLNQLNPLMVHDFDYALLNTAEISPEAFAALVRYPQRGAA